MESGTAYWHMDDVLQPHSLNDIEGFINYNEGELEFFLDIPNPQHATQDSDHLLPTEYDPQPFFSTAGDWLQDVTAQPEIGVISPYLTELSLQHDLAGGFGFNASNTKLPYDQADWLDSYVDLELQQHNLKHLSPPAHEAEPESPNFAAEVSKDPGDTQKTPPLTSSDEHRSTGSRDGDPSTDSPSREDAFRALEILQKYFSLDANRSLLQRRQHCTLETMNELLRPPLDCKRDSSNSPEHDDGFKVGRATISRSQKKALEDLFSISPYPSTNSVVECYIQTGLSAKTIKIWFANARARKQGVQRKYDHDSTIFWS
jgi:hypothetical protein